MIQDPNPTDYPHLEAFMDWMYDHVEELPADVETLKARIQNLLPDERIAQMRKDVDAIIAARKPVASNPQEQASTTAKTLTQEEIEEREQATCEIYDEREREWRDDGRTDGYGESYAERQV